MMCERISNFHAAHFSQQVGLSTFIHSSHFPYFFVRSTNVDVYSKNDSLIISILYQIIWNNLHCSLDTMNAKSIEVWTF